MIRVVIADDQALIRAGLRLVVQAETDVEVVGEAADGEELLAVVQHTEPDVALVDIRMPRLDGLAAARRIRRDRPEVKIVALTTFDDDVTVRQALDLGVHGFVLKVSPPERLVAAIRSAVAGDVLVDPVVTRHLLDAAAGRHKATSVEGLTPREVDVLGLLARGLSNAEIAQRLVVGETTVKTHVARLLSKLGLRDRLQAAVWAHDHGIGRGTATEPG